MDESRYESTSNVCLDVVVEGHNCLHSPEGDYYIFYADFCKDNLIL